MVAGLDRLAQAAAFLQFLPDSFRNDDVGIDPHAQWKDDTSNAGQCQGKLRDGKGKQLSRHLKRERNAAYNPQQAVVRNHKQTYKDKGDQAGLHHHIQRAASQRRADRAMIFGGHGKRQRTRINFVG